MMQLTYSGSTEAYPVRFKRITANIIEIRGDFPEQEAGFFLSRAEVPEDAWNYTDYTTIYRETEGGVQFSNDGSVYAEPGGEETIQPTPEEMREGKVQEMHAAQQSVIRQGIDVVLTDGTMEHFSLTDHDQTSLMGLQTQAAQGAEQIPWHTSDETEHCKFYSNADMARIITAAMECVTWHVTYYRDLRIYIRTLQTKEEIEAVTYGMEIPEEYRSEPLKAMITVKMQTEAADEADT